MQSLAHYLGFGVKDNTNSDPLGLTMESGVSVLLIGIIAASVFGNMRVVPILVDVCLVSLVFAGVRRAGQFGNCSSI
jgi:uncharacterized membrane protein